MTQLNPLDLNSNTYQTSLLNPNPSLTNLELINKDVSNFPGLFSSNEGAITGNIGRDLNRNERMKYDDVSIESMLDPNPKNYQTGGKKNKNKTKTKLHKRNNKHKKQSGGKFTKRKLYKSNSKTKSNKSNTTKKLNFMKKYKTRKHFFNNNNNSIMDNDKFTFTYQNVKNDLKHNLVYGGKKQKYNKKHNKTKTKNLQKGGNCQYMNNIPYSTSYRTGGVTLHSSNSALANPVTFAPKHEVHYF